MNCPFCGNGETKVVDKRLAEDGRNRRRRECTKCSKRFTTYEKPEGLLAKVIKRDGSQTDFDREKIASAIWAAAQSVGGQDKETSDHLADRVIEKLEEKFGGVTIPTVEQVQDIVEKTLVEEGHYKTAKAYILYREQHKKLRETKSVMVDVVNTVGEYLDQTDWRVKENSNEAFSFSGLLLHTAGKVMSYYNLNQMYTPDISEAHKKGYFHIHDLSHGVIGYCCGHSLKNLLIMGFGGVRNKTECRPAKHLSTVVHQMVNYIGCLQMEFAGAQAFSSVDTLLAPFIRADNLAFKDVKQAMQQLVFSLNIPSRWGCFSDDTEILTKDGWRNGLDINVGDTIATFNPKTEKIEYRPVLKMTKDHYTGKMMNLKNRITDQLVTPNHRVLRRIHNYQEGISPSKYVFEEVSKLKTKIPLIPLGGNFEGNDMSEDKVKLLSWIVSEGSLCEDERIAIHQSAEVNPDNCEEIRGILGRLNIPFDESMKLSGFTGRRDCVRFRLNRPESKNIYSQFFPEYKKNIPRMLGDISTGQTRTFLDTYMKADGWAPEHKIYTKKKDDADMMQEMIAKAGWGSTCLLNKNGIYVVRVIKHNYTQVDNIDEVDYDGMVWCPTTTNGTVIARRKGKVFISGNSQYPFSNITFDIVPPDDMKKQKAIVGGREQEYTYGEMQKEMNMINKAFIEVMLEGDAKGGVFTFPIPTYNLTKDFDWDSENAKLLFELTAKYGLPYFQNYINSGLDPQSIRAMCCRLNINQKELMARPGGMWGPGDSSISGDTPIYIKCGDDWQMKPIADVHKEGLSGFKTLSFDPLNSEIREAEVKECVKHGMRDVFKLRTNTGTIKITEDHCMFNISDGGDIMNATLEDMKRCGYFIAPKSHIVGSKHELNIAEQLIKNGFCDKRARVLVDEDVFNRIMSSDDAKDFIKGNYRKKFADIKCNWKHSNFGMPTISFELFKRLYANGAISRAELSGMKICKTTRKFPLVIKLNYDAGLMAGLFLSEGSSHEACLACNSDMKILEMCAKAAENVLGSKPALYAPTKKKIGNVSFNSGFAERYLGFGLGLAGHSRTKGVPGYLPNSNQETIRGLIDGYYLGDGHKSSEYIELTTVSKRLADGLMLSLKRSGSRFVLKEYKKKGSGMVYAVRIFDYKGRVVSIERDYGKDIRHLSALFNKGAEELKKKITVKQAIGFGLPQPFYNRQYMPRENTVIAGFRILEKNGLMNGYFDAVLRFLENYERVDVLEVKRSGREDVYDLSVPGHENFVAGNGMFFTHNTGSIGVVTLNLNRLGYEARMFAEETKTDDVLAKARDEYFNKLKFYMTLAKNSLETKREVVEKNLANGLMPYTKRYLGTFKNHFSTIGLCGMNEACLNLIGKDIASPEGKQLAIDTLMFMRDMCLQFQNETGSLYNLEATPAEGASYRLARLDKQAHPEIITSGTKEPYLTNSTQLPVGYTDDAILAIEHQNDIQPLYTGGTIFHLFVGERISDGETCKRLVRKVAENTRLPYFSITPTFSVCPVHGYVKGEHFLCPVEVHENPSDTSANAGKSHVCDKHTEVYSRIVGYFRPVQNWNAGKQEEFKDRLEYSEAKTMKHDMHDARLEEPVKVKAC